MAEVPGQASSLFYRLRLLRRVLPLATFLAGMAYEVIEHGLPYQRVSPLAFAGELLFYSIIGPLLIFFALTWLMQRVAERDAAERRLSVLYEVNRQTAAACNLDELQQIALSIPERIGLIHASSALIIQDGPARPWLLVGTRGFGDGDVAAMQAALASRQDQPECVPWQDDRSYSKTDCPLLRALTAPLADPLQLASSLSLSREPSRRVVMGIYVPPDSVLPGWAAETLEALAAGLALALDRASFRAHERQLLQQVQRNVATQQLGLLPPFDRILADIAGEHPIEAAAVYLLRDEGREQRLICTASWPGPAACATLVDDAITVTRKSGKTPSVPSDTADSLEGDSSTPHVQSLPITSEEQVLGVLVLASHFPEQLPHLSILNIVASMMALMIRNAYLFRRLESQAVLDERNHLAHEVHDGVAQALAFYNFKVQQVQRLFARGDIEEASLALQELRSGGQEVYEDVRRLVRELSEAEASASPAVPPDAERVVEQWIVSA